MSGRIVICLVYCRFGRPSEIRKCASAHDKHWVCEVAPGRLAAFVSAILYNEMPVELG